MTIITGTSATRTAHALPSALFGLFISGGIPAALVMFGMPLLGWEAISWFSAILWGVVATAAFTLFGALAFALRMTRMDLLDLLGSLLAPPRTLTSRVLGAIMHHAYGAFFAVAWAFGTALLGVPADWRTGLIWGFLLWGLACILMSSIGAVHPAIQQGTQDDPGTAALNFGRMTPLIYLLCHLIYGGLLGWFYRAYPLS